MYKDDLCVPAREDIQVIEEERKTMVKLREALHQEDVWMRQRSRVQWLHEGDHNTKSFHAQAAQRRRMNRIQGLHRQDGTACVNVEEDKHEVQSFFENLYTSQGFNDMTELLDLVPTRVSPEMNYTLDKLFEPAEVKVDLFQMAPSKAPGKGSQRVFSNGIGI